MISGGVCLPSGFENAKRRRLGLACAQAHSSNYVDSSGRPFHPAFGSRPRHRHRTVSPQNLDTCFCVFAYVSGGFRLARLRCFAVLEPIQNNIFSERRGPAGHLDGRHGVPIAKRDRATPY